MPRIRLLRSTVAIATLATVGALALPTAAHADPGDAILVFSNPAVVDTGLGVDGGEYEWISAAITDAGYLATPFDGGDGSATAWTTALATVDVFVLPEQENGVFSDPSGPPPAWLSAGAKTALIDWIHAGGTFILSGACDPEDFGVLSDAVGVDYSSVAACSSFSTADRWVDDASLPTALPYANGSYAMRLSDFSAEQLAPLTVWYSGAGDSCDADESLAAGVFAAGSGRIASLAWDYYNDTSIDQTPWNTVLAALIESDSETSSWSSAPPPAVTKEPITATMPGGEALYTISPRACGTDEHSLFRVHPGLALAAPVGSTAIDGFVAQGAWSTVAKTAYLPVEDGDGRDVLVTVDPATGAFAEVAAFSGAGIGDIDDVPSLAIGPNGAAYAFLEDSEYEGTYYELALFSLNLADASLTFIAAIDEDLLNEPNGFAADPRTGLFYAFEEDGREFFRVDVANGNLTSLGVLDAPSMGEYSDVTALQIDAQGTFWVVFDEAEVDAPYWAGMLATFTLGDIAGGTISAHEVGILTDDELESWSLLIVPASLLAATGADLDLTLAIAALILLAGVALVVVRSRRRRIA